jgi:hypothetical protein
MRVTCVPPAPAVPRASRPPDPVDLETHIGWRIMTRTTRGLTTSTSWPDPNAVAPTRTCSCELPRAGPGPPVRSRTPSCRAPSPGAARNQLTTVTVMHRKPAKLDPMARMMRATKNCHGSCIALNSTKPRSNSSTPMRMITRGPNGSIRWLCRGRLRRSRYEPWQRRPITPSCSTRGRAGVGRGRRRTP